MTENSTNKQIILAIDSSSGACSVAIWKNNAITGYCEETSMSQQSKRLVQMVEEALAESSIGYSDLSSVACTVGPGSFTGIRIGLATARAIGFAANIPVNGFSSLAAVAYAEIEAGKKQVKAILNAGKGEAIIQDFNEKLEELSAPNLVKMEKDMAISHPTAYMLAKLSALYPHKAVEPFPFYVRPPDAKLPQGINATP
jgi:tRNA threonylcarbamoyladenosine biosynthesis protein TsaB